MSLTSPTGDSPPGLSRGSLSAIHQRHTFSLWSYIVVYSSCRLCPSIQCVALGKSMINECVYVTGAEVVLTAMIYKRVCGAQQRPDTHSRCSRRCFTSRNETPRARCLPQKLSLYSVPFHKIARFHTIALHLSTFFYLFFSFFICQLERKIISATGNQTWIYNIFLLHLLLALVRVYVMRFTSCCDNNLFLYTQ